MAIITYCLFIIIVKLGFNFSDDAIGAINELIQAGVDLIFCILCFMLVRPIPKTWTFFFILLGISNVLSTLLHGTQFSLFFNHHEDYVVLGPTIENLSLFFEYGIQLVAFVILSMKIIIHEKQYLKEFWHCLLPTCTVLITIIVATMFYDLHSDFFSLHTMGLFITYEYLLMFLCLIFSLPMIKNLHITLLFAGFLFVIIAHVISSETLASKTLFHSLLFNIVYPHHIFWFFGKILLIFATKNLFAFRHRQERNFFFSVENTRPQIIYWGNNIAFLLFIVVAIHGLIFGDINIFSQIRFQVRITMMVPFVSFLSLLTIFFSRLFTHDYAQIKRQTSLPADHYWQNKESKSSIYFYELRKFSQFLTFRMRADSEKTSMKKRMLNVATHAAHDIRSPLNILSILLNAADDQFNPQQKKEHQQALTEIRTVAEDLLALQAQSASGPYTQDANKQKTTYIAIVVNDILQRKVPAKIEHTTTISRSAWFSLVSFDLSLFKKSMGDSIDILINNNKLTQFSCDIYFKKQTVNITLKTKFNDAELTGDIKKAIEKINYNTTSKITSKEGTAVEIHLSYPILQPTPPWWIGEINICKNTRLIVFDDESYFHTLWQKTLTQASAKISPTQINHCYKNIDFAPLIKDAAEDVLILIDYDLKDCDTNGIDYIKKYKLQQKAILVTNHYDNLEIQQACERESIPLLPKPLISQIHICVSDK